MKTPIITFQLERPSDPNSAVIMTADLRTITYIAQLLYNAGHEDIVGQDAVTHDALVASIQNDLGVMGPSTTLVELYHEPGAALTVQAGDMVTIAGHLFSTRVVNESYLAFVSMTSPFFVGTVEPDMSFRDMFHYLHLPTGAIAGSRGEWAVAFENQSASLIPPYKFNRDSLAYDEDNAPPMLTDAYENSPKRAEHEAWQKFYTSVVNPTPPSDDDPLKGIM